MRAVWSECFAALQGLDTYHEVAPDFDRIRVLRCIDAYWGGGVESSPSIHVIGHAGQTIVEFHVPAVDPIGAAGSRGWQWQGRQVIPIAGIIGVECSGPPADITISGYALTP